VRGALAEAEELDHEDGVVASGFTLLEEGVEVCAEAVFSLFLIVNFNVQKFLGEWRLTIR
jgi:hypothetical protein